MSEMIWYIHGSEQMGSMHDQFVQGPFRLILRGTTLVVRIESSAVTIELSDRAKLLASSYIDKLGRVWVEGDYARLLLSGLISHAEADRPMHVGDVMQLAGFWGDLLSR